MDKLPKLLVLSILLATTLTFLLPQPSLADHDRPRVLWVEVNGFIGPAMADHVIEAISNSRGYSAVLITLDTFGGEGQSMFRIIEEGIQLSRVPVIGFVYPPGRKALSAGTYLLMASDLAAMAPFTQIGSAQPVQGGQPITEPKIINPLIEKMRNMAKLHRRNETQAERFITHNDNLSPEEALRLGVIELIASNPEELLEKSHGMKVNTLMKGEVVLNTKDAILEKYDMSLRNKFVQLVSDPLVSALLLSFGSLILILGLLSPGFGAEVLGGIMIVLGLIGQGLSPNAAAVILLLMGAGLIAYELYSPGFGFAGIAGVISLGGALLMLVTFPFAPILIAPEAITEMARLVVGLTAIASGFFGFLIYKATQVIRRKKGYEYGPSGKGRAVDDIGPGKVGYIITGGEYWKATSNVDIKKDSYVRIVGKKEGILVVEPDRS